MNKKNVLVMAVAMLLVAMISVGGTLAWLTDKTDEVTNTFTTAGIDIDLTETPNTDTNDDGKNDTWTAQLIPGMEYSKDPVVSVVRPETDVDIYLFVKFEETVNEAVLAYESTLTETNGWTKLTGVEDVDNVWYRTVDADATTISWNLLKDNKVSIPNTVTKDKIPSENGTMKWTAYAIQTSGMTDAADAWSKIGN